MRRVRDARGYTLLEVAVVVALTSVLLVLGVRWLHSLTTAALVSSSAGNSAGGEITYALDRMEDDLRRADHCDPYGADEPLRQVTPDSLVVVTRTDDELVQVSWRLRDGQLERAEVPCADTEVPGEAWRVVAGPVKGTLARTSGAVSLVAPVRDGSEDSTTDSYQVCAQGCSIPAVKVGISSEDSSASTVRTMGVG